MRCFLENVFSSNGKDYKWKTPPGSAGSFGFHNVWNYYPNIKAEEIVIATALVSSKSRQSVIADIMNEWYCRTSVYINSNKIYDRLTSKRDEFSRGTLNKGDNLIIVKIEAIKEPGFNLILYPESRAEISGIIKDKSGNPVPFANVRVYEINSESWYWDNTDSDGKYEVNIFPVIDNGQYNLWVWGGEKEHT